VSGSKSNNCKILIENLQEDVKCPESYVLPFGSCEHVLKLE